MPTLSSFSCIAEHLERRALLSASLAPPPAPLAPDLALEFDSGYSSSDNITNWNNAPVSSQMPFSVFGVSPGAEVRLYAADELIGLATGNPYGSALLYVDGRFADGVHAITARQRSSPQGA